MSFKQIIAWIAGIEIVTWLLIWMNLRTPWVDPHDGSLPPTKGQVILTMHSYMIGLVAFFAVAIYVIMRTWKASNKGRRR